MNLATRCAQHLGSGTMRLLCLLLLSRAVGLLGSACSFELRIDDQLVAIEFDTTNHELQTQVAQKLAEMLPKGIFSGGGCAIGDDACAFELVSAAVEARRVDCDHAMAAWLTRRLLDFQQQQDASRNEVDAHDCRFSIVISEHEWSFDFMFSTKDDAEGLIMNLWGLFRELSVSGWLKFPSLASLRSNVETIRKACIEKAAEDIMWKRWRAQLQNASMGAPPCATATDDRESGTNESLSILYVVVTSAATFKLRGRKVWQTWGKDIVTPHRFLFASNGLLPDRVPTWIHPGEVFGDWHDAQQRYLDAIRDIEINDDVDVEVRQNVPSNARWMFILDDDAFVNHRAVVACAMAAEGDEPVLFGSIECSEHSEHSDQIANIGIEAHAPSLSAGGSTDVSAQNRTLCGGGGALLTSRFIQNFRAAPRAIAAGAPYDSVLSMHVRRYQIGYLAHRDAFHPQPPAFYDNNETKAQCIAANGCRRRFEPAVSFHYVDTEHQWRFSELYGCVPARCPDLYDDLYYRYYGKEACDPG